MRNPYLWQQSLRVSIFSALFPLLAAKIATLFLLLYVASDHGFSFEPVVAMTLLALSVSIVVDLFTIYHLTTSWHRLNRHPWVIMPGALINLALAAGAMVPLAFAALLSAMQFMLGASPAVTWGIWALLGVAVILGFVQVVASLRLTIRLWQQRAGRR